MINESTIRALFQQKPIHQKEHKAKTDKCSFTNETGAEKSIHPPNPANYEKGVSDLKNVR